ncbi:MAG: DUF2336 domain-containing protein [Proteobacteria bacterium]|nr:DUF2336 domain-containing protein [Pseudomonadota bacterium]
MAQLTADLITRLRENGSPDVRRETATLLTREFSKPDLSPTEQRLAEAIFRVMVRDTDVAVRRALAEGLKDNPAVPSELAMTLARDVAEVATPMLIYSVVFTDAELIEIARSQPGAWQQALACRKSIPAAVSDALVEAGSESTVKTLVRNPGAELSDETSNKVIDRFAYSEAVMAGLIERPNFPARLAERLLTAVSDTMRRRLAGISGLSPAITDQLVARGQEVVTLEITRPDERQAHLERLVRNLDVKGRLTPHLILRALCTGHLAFFETAAARRAGIEPGNVHALITNGDKKGAAALCRAARLPRTVADVLVSAAEIHTTIDDPNSVEGRALFQAELIECLRPRYPDLIAGKSETLIAKLAPLLNGH